MCEYTHAWFERLARRKKKYIRSRKIQTFLVVNFLKSQGTTFIKIGSISHFLSRKYLRIEFDRFIEKEQKSFKIGGKNDSYFLLL